MTKKEILALSNSQLNEVVKVQGTDFDRKRKFTTEYLVKAIKMYKAGFAMKDIAKTLDVDIRTVRYNMDPSYRKWILSNASGKHTGIDTISAASRAIYKRTLVNSNAYVNYPRG